MEKFKPSNQTKIFKFIGAFLIFTMIGYFKDFSILMSLSISLVFTLIPFLILSNDSNIEYIGFNDELNILEIKKNNFESIESFNYSKIDCKILKKVVGKVSTDDVLFFYYEEKEFLKIGTFADSGWKEDDIKLIIAKVSELNFLHSTPTPLA